MGTSRKRRTRSRNLNVSAGKNKRSTKAPQAETIPGKFVSFVRGDESKYKPKPRTDGYFSRPLAPARWPVLAGVAIVVTALLYEVGALFLNDYVRAFACFAVIASGAAVLDITGRKRAEKSPHLLYRPEKLPTSTNNRLKIFLVLVVLVLVVTYASIHAQPGTLGSPLPYFLAAEFFILLMPQLLSYLVLRGYKKEH